MNLLHYYLSTYQIILQKIQFIFKKISLPENQECVNDFDKFRFARNLVRYFVRYLDLLKFFYLKVLTETILLK